MLPRYVVRERIEILHSLGYVGPLWPRCTHVVTIHDLNFLNADVAMTAHKRLVLGRLVQSVARRADAVITVSHFSKREIAAHLRLSDDKISVTPLAPANATSSVGVTRCAGRHAPYIIAFASQCPHKNIPALIRSFSAVAPSIPHQLVIVGHLPRNSSVNRAIAQSPVASRIRATGFVTDQRLRELLAGADFLAFPSLYEGFGLPVLDAQAAGVAVIAATSGALPEIAGEGVLLFNPRSDDDIGRAILTCALDPALRHRLAALGTENVTRFSWTCTAAATVRVYKSLYAGRFR